jgi:ABC transport system ATP-binding/permease protein
MASPLINCQSITKTFGARPLFANISLTVSEGERIGLIGPNGAGKTTLMQILAGIQEPDSGTVSIRRQARIGYVPQQPEFPPDATVRSILEEAIADDHLDETEREALLNVTTGRAGFTDWSQRADALSGGWRKRLAIARELVRRPDVLLLDEPTNHLDLNGILWLEKFLVTTPFASVIVSHDRYFLQNAVSDMAEINRLYPDGLIRVKGNYSEFLSRREEFLEAQSKQRDALATKVRKEVEWLSRGAKARTSKSKARIDSAGRLIMELADVNERNVKGMAQIDFSPTERKTKRLIHAEGLRKTLGGKLLFDGLRLNLSPGVRLGLAGANGTGKSTLLKMLLGTIEPDAGILERADALRIVYFDQNREQLDLDEPLRKALAPHGDSVIYRDSTIHVVGWAKRFLFREEQLDVSLGRLSGGERARVLIARLMLQPADVLLLDEPTNDLDIPTLEVLEENLVDFQGALVLVTHDRYLLDRVSTTVLGLDGRGGAQLFANYSQWEESLMRMETEAAEPRRTPAGSGRSPAPQRKRLSYIEAREWESIEALVEASDRKLAERREALEDPEVHRDPKRLRESFALLEKAQDESDRLYARWAELEAKQK